MDIPACGTLLLAEHNEGLAENFRIGVEAESFLDGEEMVDKISYYDKNWIKAARMARKGHERVLHLPSYADRARVIVEDVNDLLV